MAIKPMLFNTAMVRQIQAGVKTVTRRVVRSAQVDDVLHSLARIENRDIPDVKFIKCLCTAPCEPGDILYVRETWAEGADGYEYKADHQDSDGWGWRPSIHMPREAARLFLRVTDVRVERLQNILDEPPGPDCQVAKEGCKYSCDFPVIWDSTIKPADRAIYGWGANPWVWVIEFERFGKPKEAIHGG